METLIGESFDRYGRYRHLWSLRSQLGPDPIAILDVGDPNALVGRLFPGDVTVSIDLFADVPRSLTGHTHILASGLHLPFPDGAFDLVSSHDAFEHVPDVDRPAFVAELLRVSRGPVLLVAPFGDPRTQACERIVNGFFVARLGHSLAPLDEHEECHLPSVEDLSGLLERLGVEHSVIGDGGLDLWIALWLLKAHLVSERDIEAANRLDRVYNETVVDHDVQPPYYRRVVLMRPGHLSPPSPPQAISAAPTTGVEAVAADLERLHRLAFELTMALGRGERPTVPASHLRAWAEQHRNDDGETSHVALALEMVLDRMVALEAFGSTPAGEPLTAPPVPAVAASRRPAVSVAVIIVNLNGVDHLPDCLDSLAAQTYPRDLTRVYVVDNGSTDGSLELLRDRYPWVGVLAQGSNLGFAPAVTIGVDTADGVDCVAFINNDMRADPDWLAELVDAYDPEAGVMCVAGQILDWKGEHLDFGEGSLNFYGMGGQVGFGRPVEEVHLDDGRDLLFACGGSMLVSRSVYLDSGGFDPKFFAYFEDTDFGWRLHVLGFRVVLAARARTFHRHHGTSSRFAYHERLLLYERNALRSMIKNYADETLQTTLGPALLLAVRRAVVRGKLDRSEFDIGRGLPPQTMVDRNVLAHLHAINDVIDDLPGLLEQRRAIQAARRVPDDTIIEQFRQPLMSVLGEREYLQGQEAITETFNVVPQFSREHAYRLLIVSADDIAANMRGPAIRAWEIAKAMAGSTDVKIAAPSDTELTAPGVTVEVYTSDEDLARMVRSADVVLVQGFTAERYPSLLRSEAVLVVDLYDPWLFENLEIHRLAPWADGALRHDVAVLNQLLDHGDYFLCASERQRDYWLGMLSSRGRLDSSTYAADPTLRHLIDIVPFGLEPRPPLHRSRVLKGVHPAVADDDLVVMWGGGVWDWFDPVTLVEAFEIVVREVPNARLFFLGMQLAGPNVVEMKTAQRVVKRAEELGLAGEFVVFGEWTPYEERESYLLEADIGVSAARDVAETRLAFRSRLLDYFWAGLPVVTTSGDVLADMVRDDRLGVVVKPGAVSEMASALIMLLTDHELRLECAKRSRAAAQRYTWADVVEPLRRVVDAPWKWREVRALRRAPAPATEDVRSLLDSYDLERRSLLSELDLARGRLGHLERVATHYEHRMGQLRRTPLYPLFRQAKRAREWARRRGGA